MNITYELNGGYWNPKDEVKVAYYTALYQFITQKDPDLLKNISLEDFLCSEPYIIGNLAGKYYLKEQVGGKLEDQPATHFIGFCFQNQKFVCLIRHLIPFFASWREIERCGEAHATDFFANSWASLVDTAKLFKYTTVEDLKKSNEAPSVQDERILYYIQHIPGAVDAPLKVQMGEIKTIPHPRKTGYHFLGWYDNPQFKNEEMTCVAYQKEDVVLYAKWGTHTFFHSNDGYSSFADLYQDFLADFSRITDQHITQEVNRIEGHGPVSDFCLKSENKINFVFNNPPFHQKWMWLIHWIASLYEQNREMKQKFDWKNDQFGDQEQIRWELNSLFVSRFHLIPPKTKDYSGVGIKEKLADSTNSEIRKVSYPVGSTLSLPLLKKEGYRFKGWYLLPKGGSQPIHSITDDQYAAKTLYAQWEKE